MRTKIYEIHYNISFRNEPFDVHTFGADKHKARAHKWRIPEKTLLGLSLLGGFAGGFLGMEFFRHKTKHWYFYMVMIISLALWAFMIYKVIAE
ncbi:MAG: DUF1294 domain-containing protein [Ruminococcus bicirculans (ex Wegman et al. 2014)]